MGYTLEDIDAMIRFQKMSDNERQEMFVLLQQKNQAIAESIHLDEAKTSFEKEFGVDQNRTPSQWRNPVNAYGMDVVSEKENMSADEIRHRMNEPFRQYFKRQLRKHV